MKKKSAEGRQIRRSASEIATATPNDLTRLRKAMAGRVDTSEIPELLPGSARAQRDAAGHRPTPAASPIREAILRELETQQLTRYQLWKRARIHCPTLPESAVYEFLRGQRQIGLQYVEALMAAASLTVQHQRPRRRLARAV